MAAMFFEICKCPYNFVPLRTEIMYTKFQVISDQRFSVTVFQLIAPPSGESGQFFYLTKNNVIHMCPEFGEDISFRSRVIAI